MVQGQDGPRVWRPGTPPDTSDDERCFLIEAIVNANDNATGVVHDDCSFGTPTGADTIVLPAGKHALAGATRAVSSFEKTGVKVVDLFA